MATKHYANETKILQTVYDYRMRPHCVLPGESVELEIELEELDSAVLSQPPEGMERITNLYRNPETQKMEAEFDDREEEGV